MIIEIRFFVDRQTVWYHINRVSSMSDIEVLSMVLVQCKTKAYPMIFVFLFLPNGSCYDCMLVSSNFCFP